MAADRHGEAVADPARKSRRWRDSARAGLIIGSSRRDRRPRSGRRGYSRRGRATSNRHQPPAQREIRPTTPGSARKRTGEASSGASWSGRGASPRTIAVRWSDSSRTSIQPVVPSGILDLAPVVIDFDHPDRQIGGGDIPRSPDRSGPGRCASSPGPTRSTPNRASARRLRAAPGSATATPATATQQ